MIGSMGSKKIRNNELKEVKKLELDKINKDASEKISKRKGTALLNMIALLSAIIVIYMGNFMNKTVAAEPNLKDSTNLIQKELKLEESEAISSIFAGDAPYVLYKQNNQLGLVKGNPAKFLKSRFYLDTDLKFIPNGKAVSTVTHRYEDKSQDRVILYGDLAATKAKYAEVTYNGKTEKLEFEASAPFMQLVEFDAVDNQTPTVKIFDTDNKDITSELMNS